MVRIVFCNGSIFFCVLWHVGRWNAAVRRSRVDLPGAAGVGIAWTKHLLHSIVNLGQARPRIVFNLGQHFITGLRSGGRAGQCIARRFAEKLVAIAATFGRRNTCQVIAIGRRNCGWRMCGCVVFIIGIYMVQMAQFYLALLSNSRSDSEGAARPGCSVQVGLAGPRSAMQISGGWGPCKGTGYRIPAGAETSPGRRLQGWIQLGQALSVTN